MSVYHTLFLFIGQNCFRHKRLLSDPQVTRSISKIRVHQCVPQGASKVPIEVGTLLIVYHVDEPGRVMSVCDSKPRYRYLGPTGGRGMRFCPTVTRCF